MKLAEDLKKAVLQAAMQGKLTKQLETDSSVDELLKNLIFDPKLSNISEDEIPNDIPEYWRWVRIGNLGKTCDTDSFSDGPFGSNLKKEHQILKPEVRIIQLSNIGEEGWRNENEKYTSYQHLTTISRCEVHPGDFVIAKMMPAGRAIIVPELGTKICLGSDAVKFVSNDILNKDYILYALRSSSFLNQVYGEVHGITRVRTSLNKLKTYILPLPPIEEQQRIVEKLNQILPLIDEYGKEEDELITLCQKFPEEMKKSVLQAAMQGKLTKQLETDSSVDELLKKIADEKAKLIEEGKIKKEKPLAEINEDEIPFDIPENWRWEKVGKVLGIARGGSPRPITSYLTNSDDGYNWIKIGDSEIGGKYINKTAEKIIKEGLYKTRLVHKGDLLLSNSMSFGRPYILNIDGCIHDGWLVLHDYSELLNKEFLYFVFSSNVLKEQFFGKVSGAVVKNLNSDKVADTLVPLPPIEEQQRIVEKLNTILPIIDSMAVYGTKKKAGRPKQEEALAFISSLLGTQKSSDSKPVSPEILELKAKAKEELPAIVKKYASLMGVSYNRITIRHQKTRWGSCTKTGNLSFNCLLMKMPENVRNYVIIHELAHRKELNHSTKFWTIVAEYCPWYKEAKQWLKDNGQGLMELKL